jgi:hypothetical protein
MGWVVLLVLVIFLDVILFIFGIVFWKFFSLLGGLLTIPVLVLGILCIKQAYDGKYQWDSTGAVRFFSWFAGLGSWVLNLFDADHYQTKKETSDMVSNAASAIDLSQYEMQKDLPPPG